MYSGVACCDDNLFLRVHVFGHKILASFYLGDTCNYTRPYVLQQKLGVAKNCDIPSQRRLMVAGSRHLLSILEYNIWIVFLLFALLQAIVIVGYFIKPIKPETRFFGWFNQKK